MNGSPLAPRPLVFVSDVHLGFYSGDLAVAHLTRFEAFLHYVKQLQPAGFYIVGDLFDFWFEYRKVIPRGYHRLLTLLEDIAKQGTEITYLAGNHDFAIGSVFSQDLGIHVEPDHCVFQYENRSFYLYHGDGLAVRDRGYHILKAILRNRWAQSAFRLLHPDFSFRLARWVSHSSRDYTTGKTWGPHDGMALEAERRIESGMDVVVMGHRHLPTLRMIGSGAYVNLGDWLTFDSFALFENGQMSLHTFKDGRARPLE